MRRHNCKNFVFSSSATVYGDPASVPITEDFPVGATTNPYGTTKAFTERILQDVCKADPSLNVACCATSTPSVPTSPASSARTPTASPTT